MSNAGCRAEHGLATLAVTGIVVAVLAGGAGTAYVVTDGFGTQAEQSQLAATAATPAESEGSAPVSETEGDHGSAASVNPPKSTLPDGLPEGFPDVDVPFYPHAKQMSAVKDPAGLYVLSYSTPDELTIVNIFFKNKLTENGWTVNDRSVGGSTTVTKVEKPGTSLVVAVGPDRMDDTVTNIYYTLRKKN